MLAPDIPGIQYHYAAGLARRGHIGPARQSLADLLYAHPSFGNRRAAEALADELH